MYLGLVSLLLFSLIAPGLFLNLHRLTIPISLQKQQQQQTTSTLLQRVAGAYSLASLFVPQEAAKAEAEITRNDVGFIDLNVTDPKITDVCWLDIQIGDSENAVPQRLEISLFGEITPKTCQNFKDLCSNKNELGYRNTDIFRIISTFSVQGGNVMTKQERAMERPKSAMGKIGHAADDVPFLPENYRILHSYKEAGIVSMMKDILNKNMQDSRFFITTAPYADWADEKYVAFGRVTKGMDLVRGLTIQQVQPPSNFPITPVKIVDSGVY